MSATTAIPASPEKPLSPNYRWLVLGLLIFIGYLNQFDRQTVSVLKTTIKAAFEIDDSGYAMLVNAFTACYAVAYIGSGWVVDRIGARKALALFVACWSLVTVGCGAAHALWLMVILRGMLGLAEPGLFPVTMRVSTVWAPDKNRGVFMALATIGTSIGSITAVPIIAWLTIHFHWRLAFVVPGVIGVAMAWLWWRLYREPGAPSPVAAIAPVAKPASLPWPALWRRRPLWGVILVRLISDPVWYFCLFWMPGYLQESKHISIGMLGLVGWIPFLCATLGGLAFTALSDYRAKLAGLRGRKYLVMATALAGPLCWLIPHIGHAHDCAFLRHRRVVQRLARLHCADHRADFSGGQCRQRLWHRGCIWRDGRDCVQLAHRPGRYAMGHGHAFHRDGLSAPVRSARHGILHSQERHDQNLPVKRDTFQQ